MSVRTGNRFELNLIYGERNESPISAEELLLPIANLIRAYVLPWRNSVCIDLIERL